MNGGSLGLTVLLFYYLLTNLLLLGLMGWDKLSAIKGWWRVPEKRLLLLGLLSGGIGGLAGMLLFHHKVNKPKFWAVYLLGFVVHVGGWFIICQHFL